MGCDIHMRVEVRKGPGQPWEMIEPKTPSDLEDERVHLRDYDLCEKAPHIITNRWYELFAKLAGVRNYDECIPISKPRGVPVDASKDWQYEVSFWGLDGHSHSWLTLRELQESDIHTFPTIQEGFLDALARRGEPDNVRIVFFFDN